MLRMGKLEEINDLSYIVEPFEVNFRTKDSAGNFYGLRFIINFKLNNIDYEIELNIEKDYQELKEIPEIKTMRDDLIKYTEAYITYGDINYLEASVGNIILSRKLNTKYVISATLDWQVFKNENTFTTDAYAITFELEFNLQDVEDKIKG